MPAIQSRVAPVASKAGEVLRTPRRQISRENICRRIVHGMAPRPGNLKLETVAHAAGELCLQPMVPGGSPLHEADHAGPSETRILPGRIITRLRVALIVRGGQSINRG